MSTYELAEIRYTSRKFQSVAGSFGREEKKNAEEPTLEKGKMCPRCGERGGGPFLKRVGRKQFGLYFRHVIIEKGVRRDVWHYVPKIVASKGRREELLRLIAGEGWKGTWHYASLLHVSERTIRRDVSGLCSSGLLIHRRYGGYVADPTGEILKKNPWLAW